MNRVAMILICLGFSTAVAAGGPRHGGPGWGPHDVEEHAARMSDELALDEEQSARLLEILQQAEEDREALRARVEEEFKPEMCALHERLTAEIRALLDADQAVRFDEHLARRAEFAEKARDRGHHRIPAWADCDET